MSHAACRAKASCVVRGGVLYRVERHGLGRLEPGRPLIPEGHRNVAGSPPQGEVRTKGILRVTCGAASDKRRYGFWRASPRKDWSNCASVSCGRWASSRTAEAKKGSLPWSQRSPRGREWTRRAIPTTGR